MICKRCGYKNAESNNFCEGCGISLKLSVETTESDTDVSNEMEETNKINEVEDISKNEETNNRVNLDGNCLEHLKNLLTAFLDSYELNEDGKSALKIIVEAAHEISDENTNFNAVVAEIFARSQNNFENQKSECATIELDQNKNLNESTAKPEKITETSEVYDFLKAAENEKNVDDQPMISETITEIEPVLEDLISKPKDEGLTLTEAINAEIMKNKWSSSTQTNIAPVFRPIKVEGESATITVTKTPFIIGRGPKGVDFILKAAGMSRSHCLVAFNNESYYISDLGSTNKVYLNKQMLKPNIEYQVKNGDKVSFGKNQYCFELVE